MKSLHARHARALAAFLLIPAAALAQGQPRRISFQTVIDQPGTYVLTGDIQVQTIRGAGILITASGVDLDLAGNSIVGPGGGQGTGIHVRATSGVSVRNGKLANLAFGMVVENSSNVVARDLQFRGEGLTPAAPPPETAIMIVQSRNVVFEHNAIYNVGLGVFVRGGRSGGNRIANNTITAGIGTFAALGICYNPAPTDAQGPKGDLIYGNLITGYPVAIQMNSTSAANVIRENTLIFTRDGIDGPAANPELDNVEIRLP